MASLEILDSICNATDCARRATRMLRGKDGEPVGMYCGTHAQRALIDATKNERGHGSPDRPRVAARS